MDWTEEHGPALDLKHGVTNRGFDIFEFKDFNKQECSLQKSSLATIDAVWLGIDDDDTDGRMHLTRRQVEQLLPILKHFVNTGDLT